MLGFALRMLGRDWRAGELRILALALVIAVASVTSVAFFADRVRQALLREAHQLLGADVVLTADHPWRKEIRDEIARRGLKLAENTSFISMARSGGESQLAGVKAVTDGYPLRGNLRTAPGTERARRARRGGAAPGHRLDRRAARRAPLGAKVGDRIELGEAELTVAAILTLEPDRSVSFFNIAPRLMMNRDDLAKTKLIQTGSRAWYYLLAAGEPEAVGGFEAWLGPRLGRGESMQSLANARPEIRAGIERAQKFIGLTALLAVILAAVAVSLATRRYTLRHLDGYAVMRCLGATQGAAHAPLRVGVRGARDGGLRRGLLRRLSRPARDRRVRRRTDDRRAAAAVAPARGAGFSHRDGAAARLRPAAAPSAQERPGAARDPPRRRPAEAERARRLRGRRGRGRGAPRLAGRRREARADRPRRVRRGAPRLRRPRFRRTARHCGARAVRRVELALRPRIPAAPCPNEHRADPRAQPRSHGDPAPLVHARRPPRHLALQDAAGRAEPIHHRHPARAARAARRALRREPDRRAHDLPDGARQVRRAERQRRSTSTPSRTASAGWSSASSICRS